MKLLLKLPGSFGVAVAVLACMFVLTYLGTVEQQNTGLFEVQKNYFESIVAWHPTRWGHMPLPGGMLLMVLLAINLAVGGLLRIRKSMRTVGIIISHLGIVLLMAAGLVKLVSSDDGFLELIEGESSDDFVDFFRWELAIYDATDSEDVRELLIGDAELRATSSGRSQVFTHPDLRFDLEISGFEPNARVLPLGPMWQPERPVVDGYAVVPLPKENESEANIPAAYAKVRIGGAVVASAILYGAEAFPFVVDVGDRPKALSLRRKRHQMPFTVRLEDFHMEEHPGMSLASVFRSDITKIEAGVEDSLRIEMNRPLRRSGLVLFQSKYGQRMTDNGPVPYSQFSVVRNPSDHWPTFACGVIGFGLLLAFTMRLVKFVLKQNAARRVA